MEILLNKEEVNSLLVEIDEAMQVVEGRNNETVSVSAMSYAIDIHLQLTSLVSPYFLHLHWLATVSSPNSDIYNRAYEKLRLDVEKELDISIVCYNGTFYKPKEDYLYSALGFGFTANDTNEYAKDKVYAILDKHPYDSDLVFNKIVCANNPTSHWKEIHLQNIFNDRPKFDLKPIKLVLSEMKQLLTFKGTLIMDVKTCKIIEDLFIESTNS